MRQGSAVELGNKIKDIDINQKRYRWMVFSLLIVFNLILIAGLVYLNVSIDKLYIHIVSVIVWALCLAESVRVFIISKISHKYQIYEKYMLVQTLYTKFIIKFEDVYMVKSQESFVDKFAGCKTNTLILFIKNNVREKIKLPFISEDIKLLVQKIMQMAVDSREN